MPCLISKPRVYMCLVLPKLKLDRVHNYKIQYLLGIMLLSHVKDDRPKGRTYPKMPQHQDA